MLWNRPSAVRQHACGRQPCMALVAFCCDRQCYWIRCSISLIGSFWKGQDVDFDQGWMMVKETEGGEL